MLAEEENEGFGKFLVREDQWEKMSKGRKKERKMGWKKMSSNEWAMGSTG